MTGNKRKIIIFELLVKERSLHVFLSIGGETLGVQKDGISFSGFKFQENFGWVIGKRSG